MILLAVVLVSLAIALLRGGDLRRLGDVPIKSGWLVLAAFALQAYLVYVPAGKSEGPRDLTAWLHIATYLLLLAGVWLNRRLPGMVWILAGLLLNLVVIAANGGFMPITPDAVLKLGHIDRVASLEAGQRVYLAKDIVLPRDQTLLWPLSDVFVIALGFPVRSAFSPGDVLVAVGAFLFLQHTLLRGLTGRAPQGKDLVGQGVAQSRNDERP
jgi:hypothetical protein